MVVAQKTRRPLFQQVCSRKLYGREKEEALLLEKYAQSIKNDNSFSSIGGDSLSLEESTSSYSSRSPQPPPRQEVVVLWGPTGCGKTTLVKSTLKSNVVRDGGCFVTVRFDHYSTLQQQHEHRQQHEQYASGAWVAAVTDLVDMILERQQSVPYRMDSIQNAIEETISPEDQALLIEMIPSLGPILLRERKKTRRRSSFIITGNNNNNNYNHANHNKGGRRKRRASISSLTTTTSATSTATTIASLSTTPHNRVMAEFMRIVSTPDYPVVLFLDDIQNADAASLEMVRVIASVKCGEPGLLMVASAHQPRKEQLESTKRVNRNQNSNQSQNGSSKPPNTPTQFSSFTSTTSTSSAGSFSSFPIVATSWSSLVVFLRDLENLQNISLTKIHIDNLSSEVVHEMIQDVLVHYCCFWNTSKRKSEDVKTISDVVVKQTRGNTMGIISFLQFLSDQEILLLTDEDHPYLLNECQDEIRELSMLDPAVSKESCDELIVNIIASRIRLLPSKSQHVLRVAACMGNVIDDSALALLENSTTTVVNVLEEAENAGLLLFHPHRGGYSFSHDRVRRAAFSLIPKKDAANFQLKLGRRLLNASRPKDLESDNIFVVSNLLHAGLSLHKGKSFSPKERKEVIMAAELHLKAGHFSASLADFASAETYFVHGMDLLEHLRSKGWGEERDLYALSLDLRNGALESAIRTANSSHVQELISDLLQNAHNVEEKVPAYKGLITTLGQHGSLQEVTEMGWTVLRELGQRLPHKTHKNLVAAGLFRTKVLTGGKNNEQQRQKAYKVRGAKDVRRMGALHILNTLTPYSFLLPWPTVVVIALRTVRLSMDFGLFYGSAVGFALCGMLTASVMEKVPEATRFVETALSMVQSEECNLELPAVYAIVYSTIHHLYAPLEECLDPLRYASRIALETGNSAYYAFNRVVVCSTCFFRGFTLKEVKKEIQYQRDVIIYQNQENFVLMLTPLLEFIENMTGCTKLNPGVLSGDFVLHNEDSTRNEPRKPPETALAILRVVAALAAYLFNNYRLADEIVTNHREFPQYHKKSHGTLYADMYGCYLDGLISLRLLQSTQDEQSQNHEKDRNATIRRLKARAMKSIECVTKWAATSPSNFLHKQKLLEAEFAAWDGIATNNDNGDNKDVLESSYHSCGSGSGDDEALKLYSSSIELAKQEGFVHEVAIACERVSDYMRRKGDRVSHSLYRKKAKSHYLQWGATTKALQLKSSSFGGTSTRRRATTTQKLHHHLTPDDFAS